MKSTKKKTGFTLAEVMIVLLVITILFAAFAPFITKRKRNKSNQLQDMWNWATRNYMSGPMNAYYNPNEKGGIYIGTTPDSYNDIKDSYTPLSKLIIRSGYVSNNDVQRQLQLRFGRRDFEDHGALGATFLADNSNLLFGKDFYWINSHSDLTNLTNNATFGYESFEVERNHKINNNVAFGTSAIKTTTKPENTAIGAHAGQTISNGYFNTYIGYAAGYSGNNKANTFIGYRAATGIPGPFNTYVGADTGPQTTDFNNNNEKNVAIGYEALNKITYGNYNVAIGSEALSNLTTGKYNVAIGYNACFGITNQSYMTCIGANSGPALNASNIDDYNDKIKDPLEITVSSHDQRTYIGTNPNYSPGKKEWYKDLLSGGEETDFGHKKYPGDATLEIHNIGDSNNTANAVGKENSKLLNDPEIKSNVTTIVNGNLIVRGKTYLTMGSALYPFYYHNNIFGTKLSEKCAPNQFTYNFYTDLEHKKCEDLNLIKKTEITSDRRLKNILSKNTDGLDKIKQLKIYNYTFKNDKDKKPNVGVIAQELQKVFPNSVSEDENGYLKIRWDEMFYAAINSIKELNAKITTLLKRVAKIESKITGMENENKKLKEQVDSLSLRINKLKNK